MNNNANSIDAVVKLLDFFNDVDELVKNYVDRVELEPVLVNNNIYITGFRRLTPSNATIELHLKEIKKTKIDGVEINTETKNEMWLNTLMFSEHVLNNVITRFNEKFAQLETMYLLCTNYKDEGDKYATIQITLFSNKKTAVREALELRKKHQNVSHTFETYNNKGEIIQHNNTNGKKELTDFELVTCAVN
jgi:hypothetical protein